MLTFFLHTEPKWPSAIAAHNEQALATVAHALVVLELFVAHPAPQSTMHPVITPTFVAVNVLAAVAQV